MNKNLDKKYARIISFQGYLQNSFFTPCTDAGLLQSRDLLRVQPPHVAEQDDHVDQSLHAPSTYSELQKNWTQV